MVAASGMCDCGRPVLGTGCAMRARCCGALLIVSGLLGGAETASASQIRVDNGTVRVTGAPGERNDLTVGVNPVEGVMNRYYASDSSATLTPGPGCEPGAYSTIDCQLTGPAPVVVDAGDGDDKVSVSVPATILGGPGNDVLRGRPTGPQAFDGGPGDDSFEGDATGYCTSGNAARGQDTYVGGEGVDTVKYDDEDVKTITASIDGIANDGASGENDNVGLDVENMTGTDCGANTLIGSAGPNALSGQGVVSGLGGNDALTGSFGDDKLDGGDGNDKLIALNGNDMLEGGPGDDFLEGGFDDDVVTGGPGKDSLVGDETRSNTIGTGNDTINADDGIGEGVSCGPGSDVANIDALDTVPVDTQNLCEVINRSAGGGGGPGGSGGGPGAAPRAFTVSSLTLLSGGRKLRMKVTCAIVQPAGCNGTVRVQGAPAGRKRFTIAAKTISLAPRAGQTYTLTLSRKARASVRRYKKLPVAISTTLRTDTGVQRVSQKLTLRR